MKEKMTDDISMQIWDGIRILEFRKMKEEDDEMRR